MPSEEVLRLLKARAAVKPLPRIALNCLKAQRVAHNGSPGLTYRGFVRQIRGVSRVAMSQALSPIGKLMPSMPSDRYRYSAASSMGADPNMFEVGARQVKGMNSRVGA